MTFKYKSLAENPEETRLAAQHQMANKQKKKKQTKRKPEQPDAKAPQGAQSPTAAIFQWPTG